MAFDCKELKKIFDQCKWEDKHLNELPGSEDEIRYAWSEEDAEFARPFFSTGLLREQTVAVRRSLYLGKDKEKVWKLCVREITAPAFDVKEVARGIVDMMDISKVLEDKNK